MMETETESANAQDARGDAVWATVAARGRGRLDLAALKSGLRKMDHRTGAHPSAGGLWLTGSSAEKRG